MRVANFMGLLDLEALVQSRNVVSVKLLQEISIKDAKESLEKFGFYKEELPNDLSLALGSYGASPMKNAELFSIFANGGKKLFLISLIEFFSQMEMRLIFQKKRNLKLEIIYLNGLELMKSKQIISA